MTFDGVDTYQGTKLANEVLSSRSQKTLVDARSERLALLDAHIERRWQALSEQGRRRLAAIAVSTGTAVRPEDHVFLLGTLSLIAEVEGTLDEEREFCETYLSVPWVCAAVADYDRERCRPRASGDLERREQVRLAVARHRQAARQERADKESRKSARQRERMERTIVQRALAVDGEGITLDDGRHVYRYMAVSRSDGQVVAEIDRPEGIGTREAIAFLTGLPRVDEDGVPMLGVFGYGLGYDTAKWLEKLKNKALYDLFHDDESKPVVKVGSVRLSLMGKCLELTDGKAPEGQKRTKVWDILKGFQSTFVNALRDWKVGTPEEWARIEAMKKQRGVFDEAGWPEVQHYCRDECRLLAQLVETYVRAHVEAGIDLNGKFHGAGSTSDAFLMMMGALEKRCTREYRSKALDGYYQMRSAFSRAFFGGRAEVSRIGRVRGPIWTADIASAYPHVLFSLPCVRHGRWRHVRNKKGLDRALARARMAVVRHRVKGSAALTTEGDGSGAPVAFERRPLGAPRFVTRARSRRGVDPQEPQKEDVRSELERSVVEREGLTGIEGAVADLSWGPLPYRTGRSSIVFPANHVGGWAWLPEFEAARSRYPGVEAMEAWVLKSECQCERPYRALGDYYVTRLGWGKEGRGKVIKLASNGCYGKFAQVIGKSPKYACRAVAGHITGSTRGRLYAAMRSARDGWAVVYAATDGLIATEPLAPPNPPENETTVPTARHNERNPTEAAKGWLGQWEVEQMMVTSRGKKTDTPEQEIFIVQPGFWFSTASRGRAKTRGTPLEVIDEFRPEILRQWDEAPTRKPRGLPQQSMFHGVKTSIHPPTLKDDHYRRDALYGRWSKRDRRINYVVNPKRSALEDAGDGSYRLKTWWMADSNPESAEYKKDPIFQQEQDSNDEQPDYVESLGGAVGD